LDLYVACGKNALFYLFLIVGFNCDGVFGCFLGAFCVAFGVGIGAIFFWARFRSFFIIGEYEVARRKWAED